MDLKVDFGELENDENLKNVIFNLKSHVGCVSEMLNNFFSIYKYDELSTKDKVRYDLFVAFSVNTLFWIYLKVVGVDPNHHELKQQITRVKEYMIKSKKVYERKTIMPRIDQEAAKRFIKSGLWTPAASGENDVQSEVNNFEHQPTKKRKLMDLNEND